MFGWHGSGSVIDIDAEFHLFKEAWEREPPEDENQHPHKPFL